VLHYRRRSFADSLADCDSSESPAGDHLSDPAPTLDLGQASDVWAKAVSHDFSVSYGVVDGTHNTKIVQATFTKADSTTVTVHVATATDEDAGDTITVNLSNGNVDYHWPWDRCCRVLGSHRGV